jgi:hypothetical protein
MQPSAVPPALPIPDVPRKRPTLDPPASDRPTPAGHGDTGLAEVARRLAEDQEQLGRDRYDLVVGRLFSAGLDLQAALALISDHRVAGLIEHVLGELDLAIWDSRDTAFEGCAT